MRRADKARSAFERSCIRAGPLRSAFLPGRAALRFRLRSAPPTRRLAALGAGPGSNSSPRRGSRAVRTPAAALLRSVGRPAAAAVAVAAAALASAALPPAAGRPGAAIRNAAGLRPQEPLQVPYNDSYTFVRVRFSSGPSFGGGGRGGGRTPGWAHDYPHADRNLVKILNEVTLIGPNLSGTNIISADDPELHRFPVAYVSEPGTWRPTQAEIDNLAAYLRKGGFLILDDFRSSREWRIVEYVFQLILPDHGFRVLNIEEPIFHSFFEIETLDLPPPTFPQYRPVFLGMHEGDDPSGRLMVIANFNNDIGDYWEYSDLGYVPIALSNEAYKFGVNYVIYALNR